MEKPLEEIDRLIEGDYHPDSKLQHLRHVFEGYRSTCLQEAGSPNPYSAGSARFQSFETGAELARKDLRSKPQPIS